jgi:thiol-disulfide isomerase/thioredoxin
MQRASILIAIALGITAFLYAERVHAELNVGDAPPDYVGTDFNNDPVTLSKFQGKVVVLTFWASWCAPCQKEMGVLDAFQKVAGDKDLQVVAVNDNESDEIWRKFKRALSGLHLKITHDVTQTVTKNFGIAHIPKMFLIDRSGHIAQIHEGYNEKNLDHLIDNINAMLVQQ